MNQVILLFGAILALCNSSAIYKKLTKTCTIGDDECNLLSYSSIAQEVSDNGIPEYGIPKMDPYEAKNLDITALGMIKITIDGLITGFKTCKATKFTTDVKTLHASIELVCESFSFDGHYKAESTPTLLALIGGIDIHGDGKAKVSVENIKLNLEFQFEVKKHDDGELHLKLVSEDGISSFEVLGKMNIDADGIFIGKQDVSTVAVNILNENSQFITKTLGPTIVDCALQIVYEHASQFFDAVPAKALITDDLSSYVKN